MEEFTHKIPNKSFIQDLPQNTVMRLLLNLEAHDIIYVKFKIFLDFS